jgi:hypothetical protein
MRVSRLGRVTFWRGKGTKAEGSSWEHAALPFFDFLWKVLGVPGANHGCNCAYDIALFSCWEVWEVKEMGG